MPGTHEKAYQPMTETMYYILLSLVEARHGYGIILHVRSLTGGRLRLAAGTIYNSLAKMVRDGLIVPAGGQDRRKLYRITEAGVLVLRTEVARLRELCANGERVFGEPGRPAGEPQ